MVKQFSAKSGYRPVKTVHTNLFAQKMAICIKLQLQIVIVKISILFRHASS